MIEQHREQLGHQLKTDLLSYMHSRHSVTKNNKSHYSPSVSDAQSVRSENKSISPGRLVRNNGFTAGTVKSLFDSCYQKPENNSKVI